MTERGEALGNNDLMDHYRRTGALSNPEGVLQRNPQTSPAEPNPNIRAFENAQELIASFREQTAGQPTEPTTTPNPSLLEQFWANIDDR